LVLFLSSCNSSEEKPAVEQHNSDKQEAKAKNIILLIGDGMGVSQVSSMYYYADKTNFSRFPEVGLFNTSSASHRITDSGAGGSAFAIGERTYNGAISVGVDELPRKSITELLSEKGYKTGVISTSQITHATPACFYAHVKSRKMYDEIARQLVYSDIDFFAGGGTDYFVRRKDGLNYLDSLKTNGFVMDTLSLHGGFDKKRKYGFLLAQDAMPAATEARGDFLPNATTIALEYFSIFNDGFFLMVEGSQIDWAGHANDTAYMRLEMLDFDKTIGRALDFAEKDGNTLVIVLADHETGGYTLAASHANGMKGDYNKIEPVFSTGGHSSTLIPVFAYGPGAEYFNGIFPNNEIFNKMLDAVGTAEK
jgi:alkaline phosphatase